MGEKRQSCWKEATIIVVKVEGVVQQYYKFVFCKLQLAVNAMLGSMHRSPHVPAEGSRGRRKECLFVICHYYICRLLRSIHKSDSYLISPTGPYSAFDRRTEDKENKSEVPSLCTVFRLDHSQKKVHHVASSPESSGLVTCWQRP